MLEPKVRTNFGWQMLRLRRKQARPIRPGAGRSAMRASGCLFNLSWHPRRSRSGLHAGPGAASRLDRARANVQSRLGSPGKSQVSTRHRSICWPARPVRRGTTPAAAELVRAATGREQIGRKLGGRSGSLMPAKRKPIGSRNQPETGKIGFRSRTRRRSPPRPRQNGRFRRCGTSRIRYPESVQSDWEKSTYNGT